MNAPLCVVVGVGPGVGLAVAKRFSAEGFRLALLARNRDRLEESAAALRGAGSEVLTYAADSGDSASLHAAFAQLLQEQGDAAVLVYNAAVIRSGPPSQLDPADLSADFAVNVVGALVACQQVIPGMRTAGRGTILLTGGGLALYPSAQYSALAIGKAGMRSLALCLAEELAPAGIHVATVTIAGGVQPGTHFDPDLIAARYWELHSQPPGSWQREIVYS
jgi:short-subunit dehydrogenase